MKYFRGGRGVRRSEEEEEKEDVVKLSEGCLARQEVLRQLLRTPVEIGGEEYENLLGECYGLALELVEAVSKDDGEETSLGPYESELDEAQPVHRRRGARWEAIGFQATAPDREFRGAGCLGLHCLLYALKEAPLTCKKVLEGPFPFAAASINMTMIAARLCGVTTEGCDDDDANDPLSDIGGGSKSMALRCQTMLETSHDGFFEVHCAALECLERARRDVGAGPMDFAGCAAAARDEVAVLLAHQPPTGTALRQLSLRVPQRVSGFLVATVLPPLEQQQKQHSQDYSDSSHRRRREKNSSSSWWARTLDLSSGGKRLFVALSTGTIRWYDPKDVHSHPGGGKGDENLAAFPLTAPVGSFRLASQAVVKFKRELSTFSVYDADGLPLFSAYARDPKDMERWCVALTEHVALGSKNDGLAIAKEENDDSIIASDSLATEEGSGLPFKLVETIGIYVRSAPDVAATRTGKALMPGDTVIVTERRRVKDDKAGPRGRSFLKLQFPDNEHGWVMEHHPTTFEPIFLPGE